MQLGEEEVMRNYFIINVQLRNADLEICPVSTMADYVVHLQRSRSLLKQATRSEAGLRACMQQHL